jgi:hypothetical protein
MTNMDMVTHEKRMQEVGQGRDLEGFRMRLIVMQMHHDRCACPDGGSEDEHADAHTS